MQPVLRGTVGATGALVIFGVGTVVLTNAATGAAKAIISYRQRKTAITCTRCDGSKQKECFTCEGEGMINWSPFDKPAVERKCICPVCGGFGQQNCFNCLGSGAVQPNGVQARPTRPSGFAM